MDFVALCLLFSYLLSGIGFLVYRSVGRQRLNARQRKWSLYTVLALSLLLPPFLVHHNPLFKTNSPHHLVEFHNEPVLDAALLACYARVKTQEGFCHCEQVQQLNLVRYQSDPFYDIFIQIRRPMMWFFGASAAFFFATFLMQLFVLHYLIKTGKVSTEIIEGKPYALIRRKGKLWAASFRLRQSYIVWHPDLDNLPPAEQRAILLHEIGHLNNRDTWEQIAFIALQMGWLLNPAFYLIRQEIRLLNELLADAFALKKVKDVKMYASLLLKMKEKQPYFALSVAFGQRPLRSRILHLLEPQPTTRLVPSFLALTFFMAFSALATAPLLNQKSTEFIEYCHLQKEYKSSGRSFFCKNCLFEDLNK